jgi:hypothetical protein
MSTTPETPARTPGSSETEQLVARLDELQSRTEALSAALRQSRTTRRIIMVAFLAFVIIAGWRFYSLGSMVRSEAYQDKLLKELQQSVDANQAAFSAEIKKLVDEAGPVVSSAFSEQAKKDMPLFMQIIDKQRADLFANLQERMTAKLENHHHELLRRHEKLFKEEFPSVQDQEVRDRMMGNTQIALDRLVKKYYVDEFEKELKAMNQAWEDFPPADKPSADEPSLDSQLLGELMDLLAIKFSRGRTIADK